MKLIIQIPCLNEEETLPATLADLPRHIPGIDTVEVLVIDDGSTDRTVQVARENGADHVLSLPTNQGLAVAFSAGLEHALTLGADIVVNTDADNQYSGADIVRLVEPILEGQAHLVVGERPIEDMQDFSPLKKRLQRLGSWVVRKVSGTSIPDTTSGFRAMSREAALRLHVHSDFSYTLETIIQAGRSRITTASVPIRTNPMTRKSRLATSMWGYIKRSGSTIVRIAAMYQALKVFTLIALLLISTGAAIGIRFLWYFFTQSGAGHLQSLLLSAILIIVGIQTLMLGLLADIISANRRLLEDVQYRLRKADFPRKQDP